MKFQSSNTTNKDNKECNGGEEAIQRVDSQFV